MRALTMMLTLIVAGEWLVAAGAQAQPPTRVEFDVTSVKRTLSDEGPRGISFSPSGRFAWNKMTLKQLIPSAYGDLEFKEVVGGPRWVEVDRFDIAATSPDALKDIAPDGAPRGLFIRLRALLEDRFQLKAHVENRPLPVYALQPATASSPSAPGLTRIDVDCAAAIREAAGRPQSAPEEQLPLCGMRSLPGRIRGHAITLAQLVNLLSPLVSRPVIDQTSLAGTYDVDLKFAPEYPPGTLLNGAPPPPPPPDLPSIYTAIREQLGLKLEATRAEVPVLVIDSVAPPTPD